MCHIAQTFSEPRSICAQVNAVPNALLVLIGSIQHGSCTIQPSKIQFSPDELIDMVNRCSLNRLHQFGSFLSSHLRIARHSPKFLAYLKSMDTVVTTGLPLPQEDEDFAYQNNLKLLVSLIRPHLSHLMFTLINQNLFGSTECGAMLLSQRSSGPEARFLSPMKGTKYGFFPISSSSKKENGYVSANSQLLELVILADSPDCPHPSLRKPDGHFHTGDLFLLARPGQYVSRGRDDDWIKSLNSLRCDTRAIEENLRATCGDLVDECIVVGTGRPSPALFVEPKVTMDEEKLKREIMRRTREFHSRRYLHEQITDPELVIVVESKELPRTAVSGLSFH